MIFMLKRYFLRRSRWFLLGLAGLCTLSVITVLPSSPTIAQGVNRATITQVLDGSDVFIQNRKAKVKATATKGQRVRTGKTRAELKFDSGAIGRLAHNSALTVGQCARLKKGTLLINGAMNGCTGSVVAGVRGTTYVMEVDDAGVTKISVMEGKVSVARATGAADQEETEAEDTPSPKTKQFRLPFPMPTKPVPQPEVKVKPSASAQRGKLATSKS
jgi:FecR protein